MDSPPSAGQADHAGRAEVLHAVLQDRFWSSRHRLFAVVEGQPLRRFGPWHHWWQSHAMSALLDRHERTGEPRSLEQAQDLVEGMRRRGRGRLTNDFHDDMGWLALALLRMPGRHDDLRTLLSAIRAGEMAEGGIAWATRHPEFRNVPSTGPAALLALRLGARTGNESLVEWGLSLLRWTEDELVSPSGTVHDGLRRHADGTFEVEPARYSYNYGLVIGVETQAHLATAISSHLDRARLVADAAVRDLTDPATGVWMSEGRGDGALFRGILARHLAELALVSDAADLAAVVQTQAEAVWRSSGGGPVGCDWLGPPERPVGLSEHVGGLLVLEAAARLGSAPVL